MLIKKQIALQEYHPATRNHRRGIWSRKKSKRVEEAYNALIERGENEFNILLDLPREELNNITTSEIAEGIMRVRHGKVHINPGYDGLYGTIKVFTEQEQETFKQKYKRKNRPPNPAI